MKLVGRLLRAFLALSPGILLRALRFGPADALHRLRESYGVVRPLEGWESVAPDPLLPSVPVDALLPSTGGRGRAAGRPTLVLAPDHVAEDGSLAPWEILSLLMLARDRSPTAVLEVGTYYGATTYNLALNLPEATIHTVDLPPSPSMDPLPDEPPPGPEQIVAPSGEPETELEADDFHLIQRRKLGHAFAGKPEAGRIVQHLGDTATVDLSAARGIQFCFIDGSHTYDYARNDTLRALSLMDREGTFVWHDCSPNHPGVVRWLRELAERGALIHRVAGTTLAVAHLDPRSRLGRELRSEAPAVSGARPA